MDILFHYYYDFLSGLGIWDFILIPLWFVIPFICIVVLLVITVIFLVLAERKILALFTIRKGPNRVGFWGLLQTFADAIKLLFKEDIVPNKANRVLFDLAPIIVFVPILFIWGLIPYCNKFIALQSGVSAILYLAVAAVPVLGLVLAGWACNNKYSLVGGIRSAAQVISYEVPMMLTLLGIAVLASSVDLHEIVLAQSSSLGFGNWFFIPSIIGFTVFFICSIAEVNRVPFDLPEAESELVSGYNVEYSGMKFALFFLAEYASMFVMSSFIACLFFGGYLSPFGSYVSELFNFGFVWNNILIYVEQVFWLLFKTCAIVFVMIWIRATLPRLRSDQLLAFAWKYLIPLSILNFFFVCAFKFMSGGVA